MDIKSRKASLEVLSESDRERVLQRAVQIDEMRGSPVADVRAAAAEAGISNEAFDQAIAELEREAVGPVKTAPARRRSLAIAVGLVLALAGTWVMRRAVPVEVPATPVEQSFVLRCLSPQQAADLVRPVLGQGGTVVSRGEASQVLVVRGTDAQVAQVRVLLDERDAAACPVSPAP
ncbi:MAG: hypothetical protein WD801_13240 [Gemmatimonadaceae bacterium]